MNERDFAIWMKRIEERLGHLEANLPHSVAEADHAAHADDADTVGGHAPSESPGAGEVPVVASDGSLTLPGQYSQPVFVVNQYGEPFWPGRVVSERFVFGFGDEDPKQFNTDWTDICYRYRLFGYSVTAEQANHGLPDGWEWRYRFYVNWSDGEHGTGATTQIRVTLADSGRTPKTDALNLASTWGTCNDPWRDGYTAWFTPNSLSGHNYIQMRVIHADGSSCGIVGRIVLQTGAFPTWWT